MKKMLFLVTVCWCCCGLASAQNGYTVIHSFAGKPDDGDEPRGDLLLHGGTLYGMTVDGGASDEGAIFSIKPDGSDWKVIHDFDPADPIQDGKNPKGNLVASGNVLYGMTPLGGLHSKGIIFSVNTAGQYKFLRDFNGGEDDGAEPHGSLVIDGDTLYGMTSKGGSADLGTIFAISTDGFDFRILHSFAGSPDDGTRPEGSLLLLNGRLYGTTVRGGAYVMSAGTIFSIGTDGSGFTILHNFSGDDGFSPRGALVSDGGRLYGMNSYLPGGILMNHDRALPPQLDNLGYIFAVNADGSGFTILHSLLGGPENGGVPSGSLLLIDGTLYGVTATGGGDFLGPGTIFSMRTDGSAFTLLHIFDGLVEGSGTMPSGGLILDGSTFFGMTPYGGSHAEGVIFSIPVPPAPTPGPAPLLDVTVSGNSPTVGEPFSVRVAVQPVGEAFDAWGVIKAQEGDIYSFVPGRPSRLRTPPQPLAGNVPGLAAPYAGTLFSIPAIPDNAAGDYTIIVGLVPAGTPPSVGAVIPGYLDQVAVTVH
jgi:uncharacterized repeat protein (TIGR03803 family)